MPTVEPATSPAPTVTVQRAVEVALHLHDMRNLFVGRTQAEVEAWVRIALSKPG
jgi:hypothetical protein